MYILCIYINNMIDNKKENKKNHDIVMSRLKNFPNITTEEERESFEEFKAGMRRLAKM